MLGKAGASFPSRTRSFSVVMTAVGSGGARRGDQVFQNRGGIAVVVGKGEADGEAQPALQARKNCSGRAMPQKAATGPQPPDLHLTAQPPDRTLPAPGAQFASPAPVVGGNRDDSWRGGGAQRLAQIAGRQQPVLPVVAVEQQNVHLARASWRCWKPSSSRWTGMGGGAGFSSSGGALEVGFSFAASIFSFIVSADSAVFVSETGSGGGEGFGSSGGLAASADLSAGASGFAAGGSGFTTGGFGLGASFGASASASRPAS